MPANEIQNSTLAIPKMMSIKPSAPNPIARHWRRARRSLGRRWREWRLPRGYVRLGTRYGGWWLDARQVKPGALLIDAGLGKDISFPAAFLQRFDASRVIGIEPNPHSLEYCRDYCRNHPLSRMEVLERAFWIDGGATLTFHLPRPAEALPQGADGVSGSLIGTHEYVGGGAVMTVRSIDLSSVLAYAGVEQCDVLKLDIEGAEYTVLRQLCATGEIRRVRQLLVEFHHGVTHYGMDETIAATTQLGTAGFRLVHTEGRNYIFQRAGRD